MSQAQNSNSQISNSQDRFYAAWAAVGEIVAAILTCAAAKLIGQRISVLAESGWLPGMGDQRAVAALTNRPEASIASIVGDNPRAKYYVGRQAFYRLGEFAIHNTEPPADSAPSDAPAMRKKKRR